MDSPVMLVTSTTCSVSIFTISDLGDSYTAEFFITFIFMFVLYAVILRQKDHRQVYFKSNTICACFYFQKIVLSEFMIIFAPAKTRNPGKNAEDLIINL